MPDYIFKDLLGRLNTLDSRTQNLETVEYNKFYPILGATDYIINETILANNTWISGNLRGVGGIGSAAKGFLGTIWITPLIVDCVLQIVPGNDTPGTYSQQYRWEGAVDVEHQLMSQFIFCFFDTGGTIQIKNVCGASAVVKAVAFAYLE